MNQLEKQEILASRICNKPESIPIGACHESWGRTNPLCNEHDNCRILEKSPEQIEYVLSPDSENVFLKACPGSGKTEVVGLKAAYTIREWQRQPGGLAVLTFTNNAADVISQRVSQFTGVEKTGYPHFIGTIDSWLHGYIAHPFVHEKTGYEGKNGDCSIRIIDENDDNAWISPYALKTAYSYFVDRAKGSKSIASIPLYANKIRFDQQTQKWEIKMPISQNKEFITDEEYYYSEAFSSFRKDKDWLSLEYFRNKLKEKKNSFNKAGLATYQDIENLCFEMLSENCNLCGMLAQRFPFIIIDECQDLSWIQLQILDQLRKQGAILHFVGDLNQAIYEFKRVDPQQVESYTKTNSFKPFSLSHNFRSCQPIIEVCRKIVAKTTPEKSKCSQKFDKPCICILYAEDQMHLLPLWFSKYSKQQGCSEDRSAIATRNWNNVSRLRPSINNRVSGHQRTLAAAIYLWKSHNHQAIDDALKYMGRFFSDKYFTQYSSNPRRHYCPECIDSYMRWRLFLSKVLNSCCADTSSISDLGQLWPGWAQHVRSNFGQIARQYLPIIEDNLTDTFTGFDDLNSNNFRIPWHSGNKNVLETLPLFSDEEQITSLRITTIHSLKGETLDAILLVSAPTAQGTPDGYWTQWLAQADSEAARLAYVASSRPRHLLAWAVRKPITSIDKERIRNLGFTVVEMS